MIDTPTRERPALAEATTAPGPTAPAPAATTTPSPRVAAGATRQATAASVHRVRRVSAPVPDAGASAGAPHAAASATVLQGEAVQAPATQADASAPATQRLATLVGLQQRVMGAAHRAELAFVLANDSWHLVPFTQALVLLRDALGRPRLQCLSGLADAVEDTPFTLWVRRVADAVLPGLAQPRALQATELDGALQAGWAEWWPAHALVVPLRQPGAAGSEAGGDVGALILTRDTAFEPGEAALLNLLAGSAATTLAAQGSATRGWAARWQRLRARRGLAALAAAALVAAAWPVRLSVVAPAEVIARQSVAVTAPAEGVIRTMHVAPNQAVRQGDLLFSLDDTSLRNRRAVAAQALGVAQADWRAAQQKAFDNLQARAELAQLAGRVRERQAEMAHLDEALQRLDVVAEHDGVLVYGDANDWLGRPVATGERIAQLAQPGDLGVRVWLPVGDAINLEPGAELRLYLQTAPLEALRGTLEQTSYQATLSPEGVASYRVRGQLEPAAAARIGLRGVAKVYGDTQPGAYWLLRRPLGAMRQWLGL